MACTLRLACSAETFPGVAVIATTSSRGSNNAKHNATASSIPGSQSIMTFRVMGLILESKTRNSKVSRVPPHSGPLRRPPHGGRSAETQFDLLLANGPQRDLLLIGVKFKPTVEFVRLWSPQVMLTPRRGSSVPRITTASRLSVAWADCSAQ